MGDVHERLAAAGSELAAADRARADAMVAVTDAVREAKAEDVPVAEIARLVGLSRLSVYRLLEP